MLSLLFVMRSGTMIRVLTDTRALPWPPFDPFAFLFIRSISHLLYMYTLAHFTNKTFPNLTSMICTTIYTTILSFAFALVKGQLREIAYILLSLCVLYLYEPLLFFCRCSQCVYYNRKCPNSPNAHVFEWHTCAFHIKSGYNLFSLFFFIK